MPLRSWCCSTPGCGLATSFEMLLVLRFVHGLVSAALGVIVVARPRKSGDPKAALRLVAQTGAQVLHTANQVSRMKTTAEMDGLTVSIPAQSNDLRRM